MSASYPTPIHTNAVTTDSAASSASVRAFLNPTFPIDKCCINCKRTACGVCHTDLFWFNAINALPLQVKQDILCSYYVTANWAELMINTLAAVRYHVCHSARHPGEPRRLEFRDAPLTRRVSLLWATRINESPADEEDDLPALVDLPELMD